MFKDPYARAYIGHSSSILLKQLSKWITKICSKYIVSKKGAPKEGNYCSVSQLPHITRAFEGQVYNNEIFL